MTDGCMGCRVPGYSHAAYCPEGRVEDLRSRLASVERERDEIMAMAERRDGELQARLAEAEALRKRRRDEVVSAYIQGANDVHANWREDKAPDFTEAAMDYALSIDAAQEGQ